jgi:hypothetical protein
VMLQETGLAGGGSLEIELRAVLRMQHQAEA